MKANSTDFSTIAHGLRVTRADGEVYGFTSARTSATIGGVLYESSQGLDVSSIVTSAGLNVDNLELGTLDDGSLFDRADIYGGVWDNAAFLIFRYDWTAPTDPVENLIAGTIGNITILSGKIKAELRGLQQYLQQPAGNATSATCRARFADFPAINGKNRCGLDAADWTNTFQVASVASRRAFTSATYFDTASDPDYASDSFLLLCNGANGSTTIADGGPNALTVTAVGDAALTTSTARFGVSSLGFDGTGDYCTIPHNASNDISTGDFTIELSFRLTATPYSVLLSKAVGTGFWQYRLYYDNATGKVVFRAYDNGGSPAIVVDLQSSTTISTSTWYDVAITRSGTTFTLYLNGVSEASATSSAVLYSTTASVSLGATNTGAGQMAGQLDHIRMTKGVARTIAPLTVEWEGPPAYTLPDDWFGEGIITWLTGDNVGIKAKVISYLATENTFGLSVDAPRDIQVGDRFAAVAGCRKRLAEDCFGKFDNVLDFQGEPHLPMIDQLTASPDSS